MSLTGFLIALVLSLLTAASSAAQASPTAGEVPPAGAVPEHPAYAPWAGPSEPSVRYEPYGGAPTHDDRQPELLFSGDVSHGGFGAPQMKVTAIRDDPALLLGVHGGWIVNHAFVLGVARYGLATRHDTPLAMRVDGEASTIEFGYGGLRLAYLLSPHTLVHLGAGTLIGAGGLVALSRHAFERLGDGDDEHHTAHGDAVFVLEPEVEAELNVVSFMRIALGFSYRYVAAVDAPGLRSKDLSGPAGSFALRFGLF